MPSPTGSGPPGDVLFRMVTADVVVDDPGACAVEGADAKSGPSNSDRSRNARARDAGASA